MYLIPTDLPIGLNNDISPAFSQTPLSEEEKRYCVNLNEQRKKFYLFFQNMMSSRHREIDMKTLQMLKSYLFNTYDIMETACTKGSNPMGPQFHSCLSLDVNNFQVVEDNEVATTIEIILSRYTYSFGLLASLQQDYLELATYKGNFEQLSTRIKRMLTTVEDACVRMAKLFYLKDLLWSSLEKVSQKYSKVAELNYHLLEAVFL
jgi:hypothetical protein